MLRWRPPLSLLLFSAFLTVALVPVLVITVWIQKNAYTQEVASVKERHLLLAHNITGALSRYAEDIRAVFIDVAAETRQMDAERHQLLMQTMGIELIVLLDQGGTIRTSVFGDEDRLPAGDLAGFPGSVSLIKDRQVRWSPVMADRKGRPTIYLLQEQGADLFVLGALNLEYIHKVQAAVTFGERGHAAIIDHQGHILAHPTKAWQQSMQDISGIAPTRKMMAGETGVIQFFSPAVQAEMIAGYGTVRTTGWGVMIPQPLAELQERARQVRGLTLSVVVASLVVAFLLAWWLSSTITRPVQQTVAAASQLARRQSGSRAGIPTSLVARELNTLCLQFNSMAEQVERARTTLEEHVAKRTADLVKEVEQRRQLEEKLRYMATHDELTGLPKRALFLELVNQALLLARRTPQDIAVCFIDVDSFKEVNDRFGHHIGDQLLKEIAHRLSARIREADVASRYGGDEFNLLLVDAGDQQDLQRFATKILETVTDPILLAGQEIRVTLSMGVALSHGEENAEALLKRADTAMYAAKSKGKNCYSLA